MSAVLRVKRRNSDPPEDALVLCKRPKLTNNDNDEPACSNFISTVAKFACTLKNQEKNISQNLTKTLSKQEIETSFKKPPCVNLLAQRRRQTKENSAENRYKVISYHRSLDESAMEQFKQYVEYHDVVKFIDIEDSVSLAANQDTEATTEGKVEKDCEYVYDLYYVEDHNYINNCTWIRPFNEDESVFDIPTEDCLQSEHDSEDSNAESYYMNSYPSTDYSEDDENENEEDYYEDNIEIAIRNFDDCNIYEDDEDDENDEDDEDDEDKYDLYSDKDNKDNYDPYCEEYDEDNYEDYNDEETEEHPLNIKVNECTYARYKQRMERLFNEDTAIEADDEEVDNSDSDSDKKKCPQNNNGSSVHSVLKNSKDA